MSSRRFARLLASILIAAATTVSAGVKQVTGFNAPDGLAWYGAWGGTVSATMDTTTMSEGAASLRLDYTLNAGTGNMVEYLHNFGTSTQDWSFLFQGLPIKIKGTGSSDRFRFMLYEDLNGNGVFEEPGEEVWVYSNSNVLSNTAWTPITMAATSFTRLSGSGNGVLDLNRIGKWRIVIDNRTGAANAAGHAWLDDLRVSNNYTIPTTTLPFSGTFLQVWNDTACACGNWDQATWNAELQKMVDAGMNTLIVQYGLYGQDGNVTAFYPSTLPFVTWQQGTLDNVMAAAAAKGVKVVVGVYYNPSWDGDLAWDDPATYNTIEARNEQVIDEVWTRYGGNVAFGGWYIPQEIDDVRWQASSRRALLAGMMQGIASHAKAKSTALPVMIAPFFGPNQPADVYRQWWTDFLAAAPSVDWIIPQDGVGTGRTDVDSDVPAYFAAIKDAVATLGGGRNFGATVESFQQAGSTFTPAPIARVQDQLKVAGGSAAKVFQFEWSYMMGNSYLLYNDYRNLHLPPGP